MVQESPEVSPAVREFFSLLLLDRLMYLDPVFRGSGWHRMHRDFPAGRVHDCVPLPLFFADPCVQLIRGDPRPG